MHVACIAAAYKTVFVACAMCVEKVMHGSDANITRDCFDKLEKYFCMHAAPLHVESCLAVRRELQ